MFYDFIYLAKGFRMRPKVQSTLSKFVYRWDVLERDIRINKSELFSSSTLISEQPKFLHC